MLLANPNLQDDPFSALIPALNDPPALYVPRFGGVRFPIGGGATVGVVDDVRVRTSSGRLHFPGSDTEMVTLGSLTALDGSSAVTVLAYFTLNSVGAIATIFSRLVTASATQGQLWVYVSAAGKITCALWDGVAGAFRTTSGATTLVPGVSYGAAVVFNGSTVQSYVSTFNPTTQTWSAWTNELLLAAAPPALITSDPLNAVIGARHQGINAFNGDMDEVRIWTGTALSPAEIAAETLTVNATPASLRYRFNGDSNNSGTMAGFNGAASANLVYCSDDLRFGPPLWSVGTARPTWDAAKRRIIADGVDDYLRLVADLGIVAPMAVAYGGTVPATAGAAELMAELSVGATTPGIQLLRRSANGTLGDGISANSVGVGAGVRSIWARRSASVGGNVTFGIRDGNAAEGASLVATGNVVPNRLTVFATRADSPALFGDGELAALAVFRGESGAVQQAAWNALLVELGGTI